MKRSHRPLIFRFTIGFAAAIATLFVVAEVFLRVWPPGDLLPHLGEESPLAGEFIAHPSFAYTYRDFDAFRASYDRELREFGPFDDPADARPIWAYFGNSFIQMEGALAETVLAAVKDRRHFFLKRLEPLPLRLAQIELLLERGWKPERIFIGLMGIDCLPLGKLPLRTIRVTSRGVVAYATQLPWGLAKTPLAGSRVALAAWVRSGWHVGNPRFRSRDMYFRPPEELFSDLQRMFAAIARSARAHGVPVTILLLPDSGHLRRGPRTFLLQDRIGPVLRDLGLDVLDPRSVFLEQKDWPGLFVADYHYSRRGYDLVLEAMLSHLRSAGAYPSVESTR